MAFNVSRFPNDEGLVKGTWRPILLAPSEISPERLVIGILASAGGEHYVERASRLEKLRCLFGKSSSAVLFAAEAALDELQHLVQTAEGEPSIDDGHFVFSNVMVGPAAIGEASSCEALARMWMRAISSLHGDAPSSDQATPAASRSRDEVDNVPIAIFDAVVSRDPKLEAFFNKGIREKRPRRAGSAVVGVDIDFSGENLVANFDGLYATNRAASVDRIKRKIFDLIIDRDSGRDKSYEMFVYAPLLDNPAASKRQANSIDEAIEELREQSAREDIGFEAQNRMMPIVEKVSELEAA